MSARSRAIIAVHLYGQLVDMPALMALAQEQACWCWRMPPRPTAPRWMVVALAVGRRCGVQLLSR
ncbi:DegT/DnrJ/EryC1/StrS family aminotransferase [Halopseudomonas pachastrellae]|nr:DegT/DnrJ/EryC1/StrS family aminotransferase [Halopseudomonas pachastrellae]